MNAMMLEKKVARLKLVADGLRRIQEFESARYLDEYAAHLAQPAQAVDVGAIQRVIAELEGYCEASEGSCYGTLSTDLVRGYTQQLTGAIQGLGEDGWKLVPLELTPEMAAAASVAVWPVASTEDREKARAAALIVLKTTMDLVPGATLDSLAAGIATMFPAYRAFLAAAPTRALSGEKAGRVGDDTVEWVTLRGSQPDPAGVMAVTARLASGREVVLIRTGANEIHHSVLVESCIDELLPASPTPDKEGEL